MYRNSYAICTSTAGCTIVMCYILKLHLTYLNSQLDREEAGTSAKESNFRNLT